MEKLEFTTSYSQNHIAQLNHAQHKEEEINDVHPHHKSDN